MKKYFGHSKASVLSIANKNRIYFNNFISFLFLIKLTKNRSTSKLSRIILQNARFWTKTSQHSLDIFILIKSHSFCDKTWAVMWHYHLPFCAASDNAFSRWIKSIAGFFRSKKQQHPSIYICSNMPSSCMRVGAFWSALVARRAGPVIYGAARCGRLIYKHTNRKSTAAAAAHRALDRPIIKTTRQINLFSIFPLSLSRSGAAVSKILPHMRTIANACGVRCWTRAESESGRCCFSPCGQNAPHKEEGKICVWMLVQCRWSNNAFSHTRARRIFGAKRQNWTKFYSPLKKTSLFHLGS